MLAGIIHVTYALSLKTENHVHSQYTRKTLFCIVCLFSGGRIKQYMYNFNDENEIDNMYGFLSTTFI